MKTCGIIAEYNPFHNGHQYQIQKTREQTGCDLIIAVMSGNFVQRGEPALVSKRMRAEAAVRNGADIVIELPYIYATQSASRFAFGGVRLLKLAGVQWISFGSECGNLENLRDIADTPVNPDHLHVSMDTGMSFPKAYSLLTSQMQPNDILAVSYLKELKDCDIIPVVIPRTSNYQSTELSGHASALAIRTALKDGRDISGTTVMQEQLESCSKAYMEQLYPYLRTLLLTTPKEALAETFLFSEGIESHLQKNAAGAADWESFLNSCTSYRYTAGRIRRCCLQAACHITKHEVSRLPEMDTLHVLAFNEKGREWLHDMRKTGVRVASKFSDIPYPWRQMEYRTTLLYASLFPEAEHRRILDEEIRGAQYIREENK